MKAVLIFAAVLFISATSCKKEDNPPVGTQTDSTYYGPRK